MHFQSLPYDVIYRISFYLKPVDIFNLCQYDPGYCDYQILLGLCLSRNACQIIQQGSIEFQCDVTNGKKPLESFCDMAKRLPPFTVCIR